MMIMSTDALNEANKWASGDYTRRLFVMLLTANCLSNPADVWNNCWPILAEDMLYRQQQLHNNPGKTNYLFTTTTWRRQHK